MPINIEEALNAILAIETVADLHRVVDAVQQRRKQLTGAGRRGARATTASAEGEVVSAVLALESEIDLNRVFATARERRDQLAAELARTLAVGDRVLIGRVSPRYLEGQTGVIAAPLTARRAQVRLDHPEAVNPRYVQADGTVHVPTSAVAPVEPPDDDAGEGDGEVSGR